MPKVTVTAGYDAETIAMLTSARTAYLDLGPAKAVAEPTLKGRVLDIT
jgi:hypothetical protein